MSKLKTACYYPTCGYYEGSVYRCGIPMYERARDGSFFIIENGKRISVAIVNALGTVIKLAKEPSDAE